jgi:hypothetical protein
MARAYIAAAMRDRTPDANRDPLTRRRVALQLNDLCSKSKIEKIGKSRVTRWQLAGEQKISLKPS